MKIIQSQAVINGMQVNARQAQSQPVEAERSFQSVLSNLQFSKHASLRLNDRDISLSTEQMKRVEDGVKTAAEKGIRDSLVLVDNVALLVNVKNNVVVTAVGDCRENVFTNIDGAVIV